MKITIRQMHPEDVREIVRIERRSFSTPWSEVSFYSELYSRYSITKVAEVNSTIVGYVCVKHIADECHLMNLAVHPDYRQRGIATMLLDSVMEELRGKGCRFLYLEVRESNYSARKLYEKNRFSIVGTRKGYYLYPTENALVMMREL